MEEQANPQFSPLPPPVQDNTSVWSRYFNVLASPSEAFEGIASLEKKTVLWIVPMIILIIATIGIAALTMSNPAVQQDVQATIEKKMQNNVQSGAMTQQQADQAIEMGTKMSKVWAYFGAVFGVPIFWLVVTLVYWLVLSFILGGEISFLNTFTVYSLGSAVYLIEALITGLLVYATGSLMTQLNLGFLVSAENNAMMHALLARFNPFTFWLLWVLCIGFVKVSNLTMKKTVYGVAGLWLAYSAAAVLLSNIPMFKSMSGM